MPRWNITRMSLTYEFYKYNHAYTRTRHCDERNDNQCQPNNQCSKQTEPLQRTLLPLRRHSVRRRQIWHQIACQELAWPLLPNLRLQVLLHDLEVLLFERRDRLAHIRLGLLNELVDVRCGDRLAGIKSRAVMYPLPELHARNLRRRGILHEPVERDASVPANPRDRVCDRGRDVRAYARSRDLSWHPVVQQIGSSDADLLAADVILVVGTLVSI